MNPTLTHWTVAAALAAACAAPALATSGSSPLAPQQVNGVTLVSGGVTLDEAAEVKRLARQYPMRLVISNPGGDYDIADRLSIWRGGRLIAELSDAGPWLLADLPPGQYRLTADFGGTQLSRTLTVAAGGSTTHWVVRHP